MKKLGNLAIVCALRDDIRLTVSRGFVCIRGETDNAPLFYPFRWDNDEKAAHVIHELNHGIYRRRENEML